VDPLFDMGPSVADESKLGNDFVAHVLAPEVGRVGVSSVVAQMQVAAGISSLTVAPLSRSGSIVFPCAFSKFESKLGLSVLDNSFILCSKRSICPRVLCLIAR
jgi:hypothetical protein